MKIQLNEREESIRLQSETPNDAFQLGIIASQIREATAFVTPSAHQALTIPVAGLLRVLTEPKR